MYHELLVIVLKLENVEYHNITVIINSSYRK